MYTLKCRLRIQRTTTRMRSAKTLTGMKYAPLVLLGILLSMTLATPVMPEVSAQTATASPATANGLPSGCLTAQPPIEPTISAANVTALALTSPAFGAAVSGDTYQLNGASDATYCGRLVSIDATFIVTNSTRARQDVVVMFGVSASNGPMNVSSVVTIPATSASISLPNWSGYQFCNNNGGGASCPATPSVAANGANMYFTQPNVYVPTGTNAPSCNNSVGCELGIWDGLDTGSGGAYVLQTGSNGWIRNPTGLLQVTNYWLWWEDVESSSSTFNPCMGSLGGNYISPGDTIAPEVYVSTTNSNQFYVSVVDQTNGKACTPAITGGSNPYTFSHTPYFEDFIVERMIAGTTLSALPKFDTETLHGQVQWGTTWYPISRPWGDSWYEHILMVTNGVTNMCSGTWSLGTCNDAVAGGTTANTYGSFTSTWINSEYT
jgi:hypothetical protein